MLRNYGPLPVMKSMHGPYCDIYAFIVDGLSVDWVNGKLYWTDATLQHIEVYDTATGNRRVLIKTQNTTILRAIVVDPSTRYESVKLQYTFRAQLIFLVILQLDVLE